MSIRVLLSNATKLFATSQIPAAAMGHRAVTRFFTSVTPKNFSGPPKSETDLHQQPMQGNRTKKFTDNYFIGEHFLWLKQAPPWLKKLPIMQLEVVDVTRSPNGQLTRNVELSNAQFVIALLYIGVVSTALGVGGVCLFEKITGASERMAKEAPVEE